MSDNMKWYIVQTYSRYENKAKAALEEAAIIAAWLIAWLI